MANTRPRGPGLASLLLALALILASAMSCAPEERASEKPGVVVTILPQAEFVEQVGGEMVEITVMVPPGASPHAYEPTPSQMVALTEARMYAKVGSGVEFELAWLERLVAANKDMLVVDCSEGIELQESASGAGGMDPHIWMSPLNASAMVSNIYEGLVAVDRDNGAVYRRNRDIYLEELEQLDRDIRAALSGVEGETFMVYHPAFGYFAREYGLEMMVVEEEGKEPAPAVLAGLIRRARERGIRVVFASPQFNPQSARVIADAIDGRVVFIDPLAGDYIANLRILLAEMLKAVEEQR